MKAMLRTGIYVIIVLVLSMPAAAAGTELRDSLRPENIAAVRINLHARGAQIGFEIEAAGDDPRVEALAAVIREAEPGGGHKCSNSGAIRFRMVDGSVVGVGLLPAHTPGVYALRLYDGDLFVAVYRVERAVLLRALDDLGVPMDDPAFED
jgi:hypothetical protein